MYYDYFGFKEAPFSIAPDPRYMYMTDQHRDALGHLVYGLNNDGGCILLTGEVGTGKTTVCRCVLDQMPKNANYALVINPRLTALELLETICDEFKIEYNRGNKSTKTLIDAINTHLIESNARNERNVLIIDEAQNLDTSVLEQLRLLTNLETNQRKLLQMIIIGQPELLEILSRTELRQLSQRITARYHLTALPKNELKAYISHRLAVAGLNVQLFPEKVITQLHKLTKGIPRLINVVCDRALLGAYVENKSAVDTDVLKKASKEVFGELNPDKRFSWAYYAPLALSLSFIFILLITGIFVFPFNDKESIVGSTEKQITEKYPNVVEDEHALNNETLSQPTKTINNSEASVVPSTTPQDSSSADPLGTFINKSKNKNTAQAYTVLFKQWDIDAKDLDKTGVTACDIANQKDLSCLNKQGNLTSLLRINRPAILHLYNENGEQAFAVLIKANQTRVTLDTGTETYDVSSEQLNRHWYGDYTLLWKKPPFYSRSLSEGSKGPVVQWLDQQLVRLNGQQGAPTIHNTYSEQLIEQVKKFQLSKGLTPDGIAGPITFIHLNTALGKNTPRLNTQG